jgi:hypothetical protein
LRANTARVGFLGWALSRDRFVLLNKQRAMPVTAKANHADRQNGQASR